MSKPELLNMSWLGPRDEMDLASHFFGKCSECHETICVEKTRVEDKHEASQQTKEVLDDLFRTHIKLKHS